MPHPIIVLIVVCALIAWAAFPLARWADSDPSAPPVGNGLWTGERRAHERIEGPRYETQAEAVAPALESSTLPRVESEAVTLETHHAHTLAAGAPHALAEALTSETLAHAQAAGEAQDAWEARETHERWTQADFYTT